MALDAVYLSSEFTSARLGEQFQAILEGFSAGAERDAIVAELKALGLPSSREEIRLLASEQHIHLIQGATAYVDFKRSEKLVTLATTVSSVADVDALTALDATARTNIGTKRVLVRSTMLTVWFDSTSIVDPATDPDDIFIPDDITHPAAGRWLVVELDEASEIEYDNSTSGLTATNVKSALDELAFERPYDATVTCVGVAATDKAAIDAAVAAIGATAVGPKSVRLKGVLELGDDALALASYVTFHCSGLLMRQNGSNIAGTYFRGVDCKVVGFPEVVNVSGTSTDGLFDGSYCEIRDGGWDGFLILATATYNPIGVQYNVTCDLDDVAVAAYYQFDNTEQVTAILGNTKGINSTAAKATIVAASSETVSVIGNSSRYIGEVRTDVQVTGVNSSGDITSETDLTLLTGGGASGTHVTARTSSTVTVGLNDFETGNKLDLECATLLGVTNLNTYSDIKMVETVDDTNPIAMDIGQINDFYLRSARTGSITLSSGTFSDVSVLTTGTSGDDSVVLVGCGACDIYLEFVSPGSTADIQAGNIRNKIHVRSDTIPTLGAGVASTNEIYWEDWTTGEVHVLGTAINSADKIAYDNSTSGLTAVEVQSAIDELAAVTDASADKDITASVTALDGDIAFAGAITGTPIGYVIVTLDGLQISVGDGVKTKVCYFSGDGGTTARTIAGIVAGDTLHWVGSVAGYQLDASDNISLNYRT